jgi:cell division protein FtsB
VHLNKKTNQKAELSSIKNEIKTEKLKSSAVHVATTTIERIGSMFGSSKVKKQQQDIEDLKSEKDGLQTEIKTLKQQIQTSETE